MNPPVAWLDFVKELLQGGVSLLLAVFLTLALWVIWRIVGRVDQLQSEHKSEYEKVLIRSIEAQERATSVIDRLTDRLSNG